MCLVALVIPTAFAKCTGTTAKAARGRAERLTLLRAARGGSPSKGRGGSITAGDAWLLLVVSASLGPDRPRPRPQCS